MRFGREGKAACPGDRCGGSTASGADRSWTLNLGLRTVRGSGPAPGEGAEPQKEMGCLARFPEMPAARIGTHPARLLRFQLSQASDWVASLKGGNLLLG